MRRLPSRRDCLAFAVSVTALSVACSPPSTTPSPAPQKSTTLSPASATVASGNIPQPTQAPARKEVSVVRFALPPTGFADGFRFMALKKGFFKEAGLDVQMTVVDAGGAVSVRGLIADQFDVGEMGPDPAIAAASENGGARLIASFFPGVVYGIYSQSKYNSLAELKGTVIGSGTPGGLLDVLVRAVLFEMNLDPTDFPQTNIGGSPSVFRAVVAGKTESGISSYDFLQEAQAAGIKLLVPISDVLPKYITIGLAAGDTFVKNRANVLQEFLIQQTRGVRYALDHKDEMVALASEKVGRPANSLDWEHDLYREKKIVNPNGEISRESIEFQQDLSIKIGQLKTKVPYEQVYDGTFIATTLTKLGRYKSA